MTRAIEYRVGGGSAIPSKTASSAYLETIVQKELLMIGLKRSVLAAVISLLWLAACGGGASSGAGTPPDQASSSLTLTLSSAGVSPKGSSVSANGSVRIVNTDSVVHQLTSHPDPQQTDCPELNSPTLAPGDQFTTTIDNHDGTCGFIDSLNPADTNFQGTITVITSNPNSGGYGNGG